MCFLIFTTSSYSRNAHSYFITNDNDRGVENEEIYIIILHCITYSSLDDLKFSLVKVTTLQGKKLGKI